MRYGVIADVHANLDALTAVLRRLDELGVERIVCLGDVVGYHAEPNECLGRIRDAGIDAVAGNHDLVACGRSRPVAFSATAAHAIRWTALRLAPEHRAYLASLPLVRVIDDAFVACHGSPRSPHERIVTAVGASRAIAIVAERFAGVRVAFFGHTHRPIAYRQTTSERTVVHDAWFPVDPDASYLINPGSVGQSRDDDPRAAFAVYDTAARWVELHRVPYDVAATRRKARAASLELRGVRFHAERAKALLRRALAL